MQTAYKEDLAYIHDTGFAQLAENAAPVVVDLLKASGFQAGVVVDLGCGGGIASRKFRDAGFDVFGVDVSEPLVRKARERVPDGDFRVGSFVDVNIPRCVAVTAIGEVFNYLFDPEHNAATLSRVFERVHASMAPGGILVFDMAGPSRVPETGARKTFTEGSNWTVLVEQEADGSVLTRHITTFRRKGQGYQRDKEIHRLHLVDSSTVAASLQRTGFLVRTLDHYGSLRLPRGLVGFVATKPKRRQPAPRSPCR